MPGKDNVVTNPLLEDISIHGLREMLQRKEISSQELVKQALQRIERINPDLNAFTQLREEEALAEAHRVDQAPSQAPAAPLLGIPMSVKDLIETRDLPTTAGSRVFGEGMISRRDATLVHRLRRGGAILIGKTNLHEFAYGVTGENSHFGAARNPWDPDRIAGGSSGGSGVAVATGMGCFSIGTDTRGSIRIPSSFCGITGLKGTLGAVPTRGVIPLSWTLDHVGPMARSVADAETVFEVIRDRRRQPNRPLQSRLCIGVPGSLVREIDSEIGTRISRAIDELSSLGHQIRPLEIPELEESVEASRAIAASEAVTFHEQWIEKNRAGYDPTVLARLETGFGVPAHELVRALQLRSRLRASLRRVFRQVDCLAGASVPVFPRPLAASQWEMDGRLSEVVDLVRLNAPFNVAGVPAMVLPCGFSDGLPIALQLIAPWHREDILFALGKQYQDNTDWHRRKPPTDSFAK